MYIDRLHLTNLRTFVKSELRFVHPDSDFLKRNAVVAESKWPLPKPRLPNVNLLLGDNGSGKSTVLQAIALASLGPAAREAQIPLRKYVRNSNHDGMKESMPRLAEVRADLRLHSQDSLAAQTLRSTIRFTVKGELEQFQVIENTPDLFGESVFASNNDAFFCAAYGATRRIQSLERHTSPTPSSPFLRGQRLLSVFQDSYALLPLINWLPELRQRSHDRYEQFVNILNQMLGSEHYQFTGEIREQDYLFRRGKVLVPFQSMSDGYRAFIAWVADLLFHICHSFPDSEQLAASTGVALVDEIDLHLHPKWQMSVIKKVARALPRIQFIFASHSPLIVGSLEWMNIIMLKTNGVSNRTAARRLEQSVHGLDADQILLTKFFELTTTRARAKSRELDTLRSKARLGDREAARQIILAMARGTEHSTPDSSNEGSRPTD